MEAFRLRGMVLVVPRDLDPGRNMLDQSIEVLAEEIRKLTAAIVEQNRLLRRAANVRVSTQVQSAPAARAIQSPAEDEQVASLDEKQVAKILRESLPSIRSWRSSRQGPPHAAASGPICAITCRAGSASKPGNATSRSIAS